MLQPGLHDDTQAVKAELAANSMPLVEFTPAVLRKALRAAGNIVETADIPTVLEFVICDGVYEELHDLYLLLLQDGSVQQLKWRSPGNSYLVATDEESKVIVDLMARAGNRELLVEPAPAWTTMSRQAAVITCL